MGVANPGNLFSKTVILMIFSLLFENGDAWIQKRMQTLQETLKLKQQFGN
jgi:hypothetical protein